MRNIIFLDIDGVFNCELFYNSKQFQDYLDSEKGRESEKIEKLKFHSSQICKQRLGWFNQLCDETNSDVVLSSSWRNGGTIEELQEMFDYAGGTFKLIDKTGNCRCRTRGCEIKEWLEENITMETHGCYYYDFYKYAIIDDDSDMLLNQYNHFFQTDNYSGLTPNTCYKIKRFFLHKTF